MLRVASLPPFPPLGYPPILLLRLDLQKMCTITEDETLRSPMSPAGDLLASRAEEDSSTSAKKIASSNLVWLCVRHPANAIFARCGNAMLFQGSVSQNTPSSFNQKWTFLQKSLACVSSLRITASLSSIPQQRAIRFFFSFLACG